MLVLAFFVIILIAMNDEGNTVTPTAAESVTTGSIATSVPQSTPTPKSKFDCRELELEFNNMMVIDYNSALMHVSTVMSLKDSNPLAYYTSGDAERELQNCGVIPR